MPHEYWCIQGRPLPIVLFSFGRIPSCCSRIRSVPSGDGLFHLPMHFQGRFATNRRPRKDRISHRPPTTQLHIWHEELSVITTLSGLSTSVHRENFPLPTEFLSAMQLVVLVQQKPRYGVHSDTNIVYGRINAGGKVILRPRFPCSRPLLFLLLPLFRQFILDLFGYMGIILKTLQNTPTPLDTLGCAVTITSYWCYLALQRCHSVQGTTYQG